MKKEAPKPFDLILVLAQHANTPYAGALFADIRDVLETGAAIEPWTSAIQLARDLGAVSADQAHFLIDRLTESVVGAATQTDDVLVDIRGQMEAVQRAHGRTDDEDFMMYDAPPEWLALSSLWDRRFQDLRVDLFRRIGEPRMASDIVLRPDDMEMRSQVGWRELLDIDIAIDIDEDETSDP